MEDPVIEVAPLGFPWPTVDPFLFCVHHHDRYPAANEHLGPDAPLSARDIGMDFSGADGWSMYHGSLVPGFPQHPHRGFETVTFARQGFIDHSDSLGATARFGRGDLQWLTAGHGIVHAEMFPLLDTAGPNPCELFQIWLNLPRADKMVDPYFTMFWREDVPLVRTTDAAGRVTEITVIAGALGDTVPLPPPPSSWASRADADLAIWQVVMGPGASTTLPVASADVARVLYLFEGAATVADHAVPEPAAVGVDADAAVTIEAGPDGAEILVLQGRPIGEPVAQYGPFVMNDKAGVEQAFADYQSTGFGGWPWPTDDPVHPRTAGRFAIHPDGRRDEPTPAEVSPSR